MAYEGIEMAEGLLGGMDMGLENPAVEDDAMSEMDLAGEEYAAEAEEPGLEMAPPGPMPKTSIGGQDMPELSDLETKRHITDMLAQRQQKRRERSMYFQEQARGLVGL